MRRNLKKSTTRCSRLIGAGTVMVSTAVMFAASGAYADNGAAQPSPESGIYGEEARRYGGPNYGNLRPGPAMGMPSPGYEPRPVPESTIYGPGARRYGGPNYGILRPESGPGMPGPGYDARPAPRSSIYGPQSRYYGGPNYGHLRPGYEGYGYQGRPGWGPWDNRPPMGQGRGIYHQPGRYQGPNYGILRPEPGSGQAQGARAGATAQPSPRSSIYGEQARRYGGPNYGNLRPEDVGEGAPQAAQQGPDAKASPDTSIYGEEGRQYGGPNYEGLKPEQSQ